MPRLNLIYYSFIIIRVHTATRIRIWWGCPAGGTFPPGECLLALGFALLPVSYPGNVPNPIPGPLVNTGQPTLYVPHRVGPLKRVPRVPLFFLLIKEDYLHVFWHLGDFD